MSTLGSEAINDSAIIKAPLIARPTFQERIM
jgi:hypothetical protein